jgi:hypothetical protein
VSRELPPGVNPYLLDLDPEVVAEWPESTQRQLESEIDVQMELDCMSDENDQVAFLERYLDWFRQFRLAKESLRSLFSGPAHGDSIPAGSVRV